MAFWDRITTLEKRQCRFSVEKRHWRRALLYAAFKSGIKKSYLAKPISWTFWETEEIVGMVPVSNRFYIFMSIWAYCNYYIRSPSILRNVKFPFLFFDATDRLFLT